MVKKQDFNIHKANFIDLFAGIGGFRLALESYGLKCAYTSEWDKFSQQTYAANFGDTPDGDITQVNEKDIPKHNIICAGFPCQAFSISGKKLGFEDTRGTLFFDVARIAKHHRPEVLFLENVKNFAKHDGGKTLTTIVNTLDGIGYDVNYKILNASHYGAPTSRERIYIICFRKDLNVKSFEYPKPLDSQVKLVDYLDKVDDNAKCIIKRDDINLRDVKVIKDSHGHYPHKPIKIGTINKGGQGERIYSPLGHAITFSAYGGGAAGKTGAYLADGVVRKLTPRECSRVMGYGEDFVIPVSDSQAYKQFGNGVAVNVLKAIFGEIIKTLEKTKNEK